MRDDLPVGTIAGRMVPFHVLYDSDYFGEASMVKFFHHVTQFADGRTKRWPEECNLGKAGNLPESWGNGLPDGQMKFVRWVSIQVEGAADDDEFDVEFRTAQTVLARWKIKSGLANRVRAEWKIKHYEGHDIGGDEIKLLPLEQFEVRVASPRKFRGGYVRIGLHGPIALTLEERLA